MHSSKHSPVFAKNKLLMSFDKVQMIQQCKNAARHIGIALDLREVFLCCSVQSQGTAPFSINYLELNGKWTGSYTGLF